MKKFSFLLFVAILCFMSCRPIQETTAPITRETWDKDLIYRLSNATDEEVLSHESEGMIYTRYLYSENTAGLDHYFQNYKSQQNGDFDRYVISFEYIETELPIYSKKYSYPFGYGEKVNIQEYGTYTLSKENGNFYFTVNGIKRRYLVSQNYLFIFE